MVLRFLHNQHNKIGSHTNLMLVVNVNDNAILASMDVEIESSNTLESTDALPTISRTPKFVLSPKTLNVIVSSDEEIEEALSVSNQGGSILKVSGFDVFNSVGKKIESSTDWLKITPSQFVISPGHSKGVKVKIDPKKIEESRLSTQISTIRFRHNDPTTAEGSSGVLVFAKLKPQLLHSMKTKQGKSESSAGKEQAKSTGNPAQNPHITLSADRITASLRNFESVVEKTITISNSGKVTSFRLLLILFFFFHSFKHSNPTIL